jgi:hypothetical protein
VELLQRAIGNKSWNRSTKMKCPVCLKPMKMGYVIFECLNCGALMKLDGEIIYNPKSPKPITGEPK